MSFLAAYPNCPIKPQQQHGTTQSTWNTNSISSGAVSELLWVKLRHLPSIHSFDEAMLLTQESADVWVAWVPEHGEVRLHRRDFYIDER
ncbi:MAG: hypothetical protein WBA57_12800 [Elainellaceae cyanobacterium]